MKKSGGAPMRDDAFNIEKEHKIINPHNMDMSTTNKVVY